jgi:hypothetical protein
MGLLTDFFLASPEREAALDVQPGGPEGQFPTVSGKNVDQVKLATLLQILRGVERSSDETAAITRQLPMVWRSDEEGPWVFRLPTELRDVLAAVPPQLQDVACSWSLTEEWRLDSGLGPTEQSLQYLVDELAQFLTELRALAVRSASGEGTLYLWLCL